MTKLSQNAFNLARSSDGLSVSFEFFPPRTPRGLYRLLDHAAGLQPFEPSYLSVTYGAMGSSKRETLKTAAALRELKSTTVAGHLTCVGASREETNAMIAHYRHAGVRHIVALRGDAPDTARPFEAHPQGYRNAADMVAAIRQMDDWRISVAAYPESHPDSPNPQADIDNLKAKLDSGADDAITQFFLDNSYFYRFMDRLKAAGISQPVSPGILLINDFAKVKNFATRCGATIPDWIAARYEGLENDPEGQKLVSVGLAVEQVLDLASQGVRTFHFYTFNKSELALAVCRSLGLRAKTDFNQAA